MNKQLTSHILMIRPASFRMNSQTAIDNTFQKKTDSFGDENNQAVILFNAFVDVLRKHHIHVTVWDDVVTLDCPDALFPNNWISTHQEGTLVIYPMKAINRRREKRHDLLPSLGKELGMHVGRVLDLSYFEKSDQFLEGTGSMVLDRVNKIAYACKSDRYSDVVLNVFCKELGYTPFVFEAFANQKPIYHTNVMMSIGEHVALVALDCVSDLDKRQQLISSITRGGKEIIEISIDQVNAFAGNALQVLNQKKESYWVLSQQAYNSLDSSQIAALTKEGASILAIPLEYIETLGGGSARCMMCEIFLPYEQSN